MATLVADASALVSLGVVADGPPDPLALGLNRYEVVVPTAVVEELRELASYEDVHGEAASTALDRASAFEIRSGDLDAALLLCDEFNQLGLIHASLADTRLVTTPTLLSVFVRAGELSPTDARTLLDEIGEARSWDANSYVRRARSLLDEP